MAQLRQPRLRFACLGACSRRKKKRRIVGYATEAELLSVFETLALPSARARAPRSCLVGADGGGALSRSSL